MVSRAVPTWAELPYWEVKVSSHEPMMILLAKDHRAKVAASGVTARVTSSRDTVHGRLRRRARRSETHSTSRPTDTPMASAS